MKWMIVLLFSVQGFAQNNEYKILEEKFNARSSRAAKAEIFPSWDERHLSSMKCIFINPAGIKRSALITTLNQFVPGSGPLLPDKWDRRILISNDSYYSEDQLINWYFDSMWTEENDLSLDAGMFERHDFYNSPYTLSIKRDAKYIYFYLSYRESEKNYGYCWNISEPR
jgi:hypothetical protein